MKQSRLIALGLLLAGLGACGSSAKTLSSGYATLPVPTTMATSWPTLGTVKTCPPPTINYYIEITAPGSPAAVSKMGNDNLTVDCRSTLSTFKALAGMGGGECTTIALASNNPQINVNGTGTAPPLRDVIESAGPGCKPE